MLGGCGNVLETKKISIHEQCMNLIKVLKLIIRHWCHYLNFDWLSTQLILILVRYVIPTDNSFHK